MQPASHSAHHALQAFRAELLKTPTREIGPSSLAAGHTKHIMSDNINGKAQRLTAAVHSRLDRRQVDRLLVLLGEGALVLLLRIMM